MKSRTPGRWGCELRRALALLLASCGLTACVAQGTAPGYGRAPASFGALAATPAPAGRRVAVLLPLSGTYANVGQSMLLAVKLAFESAGPNAFDTQDTKSTPEGAVAAAKTAAAAGAGLIVGPLTAPETAAVAPVASTRNMDVLALTSDSSKARPGLWTLGLTPAQQVRTLVTASVLDNKRRIGAILPSNLFGDSLADGLRTATAEAGLAPPTILRYDPQTGLTDAITKMGATGGAPGAPPAIDALLLGTTADVTLRVLPQLVSAGLGPERIRLLGTALWAHNTTKLAPLAGAWFAGPSAATLKVFEDNFISHYGHPPREFDSIAFDAAGAARASVGPTGVDLATLTNPHGFAGANGVFRLLPDGRVRRSLALFEIVPSGVQSRDIPEATAPSM